MEGGETYWFRFGGGGGTSEQLNNGAEWEAEGNRSSNRDDVWSRRVGREEDRWPIWDRIARFLTKNVIKSFPDCFLSFRWVCEAHMHLSFFRFYLRIHNYAGLQSPDYWLHTHIVHWCGVVSLPVSDNHSLLASVVSLRRRERCDGKITTILGLSISHALSPLSDQR